KKPMERESADQKGYCAPSVPGSAVDSTASRALTWRRIFPSVPRAEKTSLRPSGESAGGPGVAESSQKTAPSGGVTGDRITRTGCREGWERTYPRAAADSARRAVADIQIFSRPLRRAATGAGTPACE